MKNKIIIVEAPQGGGKTTVTNLLRDKMPYSTLLRLSGHDDKTELGNRKSFKYHKSILQMMKESRGCNLNFILDRSHLSESVYCNLGYKRYYFEHETKMLNKHLASLSKYYDIYIFLLGCAQTEYERRLKRDKPQYLDVNFNPTNSMEQYVEYTGQILKMIGDHPYKFHFRKLDTTFKSPEEVVEDIINAVTKEG